MTTHAPSAAQRPPHPLGGMTVDNLVNVVGAMADKARLHTLADRIRFRECLRGHLEDFEIETAADSRHARLIDATANEPCAVLSLPKAGGFA